MPKFLEKQLRAEYGSNTHAIYGTLNAIGAVKGNKETPKGRAMQAKHDAAKPKGSGHPHKNLGAYLHKAKKR